MSGQFAKMYRGLFHDGDGFVILLRANCDAAKAPRGPHTYFTIAGFLSTPKVWDRAEDQWRKTLSVYRVQNLHTKDLRNPHAKAYRGWSDKKRRNFENLLLGLICKRTMIGFAYGVVMSDYEALDPATKERIGNNPYMLCAMRVITEVGNWVGSRFGTAYVAYNFESGDQGQREFIDVMQRFGVASPQFRYKLRIHSVTPMTKPQVRVFDMADLLAWEANNHAPKALGRSRKPMTETLDAITDCRPLKTGIYDEAALRERAGRNTPEYLAAMRKEFGLR